MRKLADIDKEIERLQNEKAAAERATEALERLDEPERLAIELHDKLCNYDHAESCDWFYNTEDEIVPLWRGFAQQEYLNKARAILRVTSYEVARRVVALL